MMEPLGDFRVDWFRILVQLQGEGYSLHGIAHFTGIPKASLLGYKQGIQPTYNTGVKLIHCWAQATGKATSDAPIVNRYSHMA
jgi:hypothetical protein